MKNMKKTILLSSAVALSVLILSSCANATNITGVTGNNGVYNISPECINPNNGMGVRMYQDFNLSQGDVANLIFDDVNKFVNFVDNQIQINGIVNTVKNGNFYNGNAIFVSPNGMVVGASGVLNVGSLNVMTPDNNAYQNFKNNPDTVLTNNNWSPNANSVVTIDGKVFARDMVNIKSNHINMNGEMLTGFSNNDLINNNAYADTLFNSLVNTGDMTPAIGFETVEDKVYLFGTNGIDFSGQIKNFNNGYSNGQVTMLGGNGVNVTGSVESAGNITIRNTAMSGVSASGVNLSNPLNSLTSGANVTIQDYNQEGVNINGAITAKGNVNINSNQGITVNRRINSDNNVNLTNHTQFGNVRIQNGIIDAANDVNIKNYGGSIVIGVARPLDDNSNHRINPYYVHAGNNISVETFDGGEILNGGTNEVLLNAGGDIYLNQQDELNGMNPNFYPGNSNCIGSGCIGMPGFNPTGDYTNTINAIAGGQIVLFPPQAPPIPEPPTPTVGYGRGVNNAVKPENPADVRKVVETFKKDNNFTEAKSDLKRKI